MISTNQMSCASTSSIQPEWILSPGSGLYPFPIHGEKHSSFACDAEPDETIFEWERLLGQAKIRHMRHPTTKACLCALMFDQNGRALRFNVRVFKSVQGKGPRYTVEVQKREGCSFGFHKAYTTLCNALKSPFIVKESLAADDGESKNETALSCQVRDCINAKLIPEPEFALVVDKVEKLSSSIAFERIDSLHAIIGLIELSPTELSKFLDASTALRRGLWMQLWLDAVRLSNSDDVTECRAGLIMLAYMMTRTAGWETLAEWGTLTDEMTYVPELSNIVAQCFALLYASGGSDPLETREKQAKAAQVLSILAEYIDLPEVMISDPVGDYEIDEYIRLIRERQSASI